MESNNDESKPTANPPGKPLFLAQIMLRSVTGLLALAATIVMAKSGQSIIFLGTEFQAKYSYSSAFRFFVGTNIVLCAMSVFSSIAICIFHDTKSKNWSYLSVFLHDLIATVLSMAGCAAASAIGYVGRYGQDQIGWGKICDNATKFCNFVTISIALSYLAFICLFALTIMAFRQSHA